MTETLADWREDVAAASGAAKLMAHARGVVSVVYLAASLVLDQFTSFRLWRSFGLALTATVASAVVCAGIVTWLIYSDGRPPLNSVPAGLFGLMLISSWTLGWFAVAASIGLGAQDRSPVAGMLALGLLFSVAMVGVIVPAVSDIYVSRIVRELPADRVAPRLMSLAAQYASLWWVSTLFLLGETIRRRLQNRSWRARQAWALAGAVAITAVGFIARLPVFLSTTMSIGERFAWSEGVTWTQFAVAWIAIVVIARHIPVQSAALSPVEQSSRGIN